MTSIDPYLSPKYTTHLFYEPCEVRIVSCPDSMYNQRFLAFVRDEYMTDLFSVPINTTHVCKCQKYV